MSENGSNCSIEEIRPEEIEDANLSDPEETSNLNEDAPGESTAVAQEKEVSGTASAPSDAPTGKTDDSQVDEKEPEVKASAAVADVVEDPPIEIVGVEKQEPATPAPTPNISQLPSQDNLVIIRRPDDEDLDDEEDDDDIDETLSERLIGLTEMFPECVRNGAVSLVAGSWSLSKSTYNLTRSVGWVLFSTSVMLFMPVMIETERLAFQDQQKQQKAQMLLGPGVAHSGGPALGPPPI